MKRTLLLLFFISSLTSHAQVTDIDGNSYDTVRIGSQTWMAENLNVSHFLNGDPIPHVQTNEEWLKAAENRRPAWCYYNNDPVNGKKYGKLYNWFAVNDSRGLAPPGWHIPTDDDWSYFYSYLGQGGGKQLKSEQGWIDGGNGTNQTRFSAYPGGCRFVSDGEVFFSYDEGNRGYWWSSLLWDPFHAFGYDLNWINDDLNRGDYHMGTGFSVRCVRM